MILTPFAPPALGGAETFAMELSRVASKYHTVFFCTIHWGKLWKGINWMDSLRVISRLTLPALRMCRKRKIDTIHALGFNAGFIGAIIKKICKIQLIVTPLALYDFNNKFLNMMASWTLHHADVVFAESEISRHNLSQVTDLRKIKIFTHWVDTKKFYPVEHENKRLKVLFAGRKLKEKGAHIIKQIDQELQGVDFVYAENIPNEDMPKLFQMADVLVVPSLYAESPNRVVAEGAACGCVVVASKVGALAEQVNGFGIVIEPTKNKFKQVISNLDKDRKWLKTLRNETIAYAKAHLTETNAKEVVNEY
jgi:glycosyltransferase involved in cell wall biosynthesis